MAQILVIVVTLTLYTGISFNCLSNNKSYCKVVGYTIPLGFNNFQNFFIAKRVKSKELK